MIFQKIEKYIEVLTNAIKQIKQQQEKYHISTHRKENSRFSTLINILQRTGTV